MVTAGPDPAIYRPIVRDRLGLETVFRSPKVGANLVCTRPFWGSHPGMGFLWHVSDINYISDALLSIRLPSCRWRSATIDSQMEEGALLSGASRMMILRRITFPIVAPALRRRSFSVWKNHRPVRTTVLLGAPTQFHTIPQWFTQT